MKTWIGRTEAETETAGREIAHLLAPDSVVHLIADLGAGKTFLVRAIAAELGADPLEVSSPTFAIVHEYPRAGRPPIIHIDGYRLSDNKREWFEIGIPEMLAGPGVKLIEWPKEAFTEFEEAHLEVRIEVGEDGARTITIQSPA
jgi:tRNA threonylcarbamoyladenosine biosynthesis protein TsaE